MAKKTIIDAKANSDGDITHAVRRKGTKTHLRTNPDGAKGNNFDNMAGDK
ncbi:hypothetical protein OO007_10165 [Cocleimonas sp. KMM 6892]|nr:MULTISPECIES: hypothetical protein [unclassified Cocleimonas]MEB8432589.1 hypothetical protein [Cocleimonas sp. KMM 6892]MEC4715448.1 hypothetical protein [Cocleimonas sp. KMM 6895]MEC4744933.1 hypothetical protein [Cocleimonas sp. KMM 6896]